ncbi:winged helix-turn-helix domain-containing protein [Qipengyuania spongiae]|uniref:Transcriptional regulator n=1 Tax=Qipengyuania spongiae TaxID=2909673 RepID=A0ABY5T317_9SPHN|nr:transcriptional regulator [Qipengyuania spongiae]UVI39379.1 transcriptional regulator [Qipengyuania spongiae]
MGEVRQTMERGAPERLSFGDFELDLANRELRRSGKAIPLGNRYLDALVLLASHPGQLVTKDRFMDEVWRGIPVTDEALTQCIRTLRRALGDDASDPRFIATVPKHGYRFLADVRRGEAGGSMPRTSGADGSLGGRIAGGATIGGGLAGIVGGLLYGLAATGGGGMSVLVMVVLVAALGVLGGAGIGAGMGLAPILRPGRALPLIAGAALGGTLVGAFGQTLGRDGIAALTGAQVASITGLFEGLVLGIAVGLAGALALSARFGTKGIVAAALAIGAGAGAIIAIAGGTLLGRSLLVLQAQFPRSALTMERLGGLVGDPGFEGAALLATTMLEGAVFVACSAWAIRYAAKACK